MLCSLRMHSQQDTDGLPVHTVQSLLHRDFSDDSNREHNESAALAAEHAKVAGCAEGHRKPPKQIAVRRWFLAVFAVLFLLFHCQLAFPGTRVGGLNRRRLAERGNSDSNGKGMPFSGELREVCYELGAWNHIGSTSEEQGRSYLILQPVFENLHQHANPSVLKGLTNLPSEAAVTSASQLSVQLRASDENRDHSEGPGPSRKLKRTEQMTPSTEEHMRTRGALTFSAFLDSALERPAIRPAAVAGNSFLLDQSTAARLNSSTSPADSHPCGQAQGRGTAVHPFLRVPSLDPGVKPRSFRPTVLLQPPIEHFFAYTSLHLRELLLKTSLTQEEADQVVTCAEYLANHGKHRMSDPLRKMRPILLAEKTARRFLLFHLLHLCSRAVGQTWRGEPWWEALAAQVPTTLPAGMSRSTIRVSGHASWQVVQELTAATEAYKRGVPPSDEKVRPSGMVLKAHAVHSSIMRHQEPQGVSKTEYKFACL
ncbi:hypothetical protein Efla_006133 [Eimeria flavescens]